MNKIIFRHGIWYVRKLNHFQEVAKVFMPNSRIFEKKIVKRLLTRPLFMLPRQNVNKQNVIRQNVIGQNVIRQNVAEPKILIKNSEVLPI